MSMHFPSRSHWTLRLALHEVGGGGGWLRCAGARRSPDPEEDPQLTEPPLQGLQTAADQGSNYRDWAGDPRCGGNCVRPFRYFTVMGCRTLRNFSSWAERA